MAEEILQSTEELATPAPEGTGLFTPAPNQSTEEAVVEPIEPVSMISTDSAITQITEDKAELDRISPPPLPPEPEVAAAIIEEPAAPREPAIEGEVVDREEPTGPKFSLEEARELFGTDFTGLTQTADGQFVADSSALERIGVKGLEEEKRTELDDEVSILDDRIEGLINDFDTFNVDKDPAFSNFARGIREQFAAIRRKAESVNKGRAASLRTLGYRTGSTQFAGAIQLGIEGEELKQANQRISDINREEQATILAARQAFETQNFTKFNQKIGALQTLRENKADALEKYNKALTDANDKLTEQQEKINDDLKSGIKRSAILGLINVGINDPIEILTLLQAGGFDADPDEVKKFTSLIENQDLLSGLSTDLKTFEFLKKQEPGAFEELGINNYIDYVKAIGDAKRAPSKADAATAISVGGFPTEADLDTMSIEERNFVNAVMRQLPTKLKDSENERKDRMREALFDFKQGKSVQDTIDTFRGLVLDPAISDSDRDFALTLRAIASGTDLDLSEIAAPINAGKPVKAMINVENAALDTVDGELSETTTSRKLVNNANRVLDLLKLAPVEGLGQFDGRKFKVQKFFGLSDEETLATQRLETAMVSLFAEIRRVNAGTAVTESELKFLQPLLTDLLDQPAIIKTKLDELKVGTIRSYNAARAQVGLPEADEAALLDNAARLNLYRDPEGAPTADVSGIQGQIDEARAGGFSDSEIINVLGSTTDFRQQIEEAIQAGFSDTKILEFLEGGGSFSGVDSDTQTAVNVATAGKDIKPVTIGGKVARVDKQISDRLAQADRAMFKELGIHLNINQSFRSREQQAELFRKSQAGEIGRAAPPGKSFHEKGLAIDVTNWEKAEKFLRAVGLVNELEGDKGHFSIGEFTQLS